MALPDIAYKVNNDNADDFEAVTRERNISVKNIEQRGSAVKVFFAAVAILFFMCFFIYAKVQVNDVYNEIASVKKEIELLSSENVRMQSEIEAKMSMKNVEDYAENVLGLEKLEKSQIVYMEVQADSVIEVAEEEKSFIVILADEFKDMLEYFFG